MILLSDLIALASFVWVALKLRSGDKKVVWFLVVLGVACSVVSIYSRYESTQSLGNPPAPYAVTQLGEDAAKNQGVPTEFAELVKQKSAAGMSEWAKVYPHGYILFGVANQQVVYQMESGDTKVKMDFQSVRIAINRASSIALLQLPDILIRYPGMDGEMMYKSNLERFRFVEHQPQKLRSSSKSELFVEIVDTPNNIFLIGFK